MKRILALAILVVLMVATLATATVVYYPAPTGGARMGPNVITGLSTDVKPTDVLADTRFLETDTGAYYVYTLRLGKWTILFPGNLMSPHYAAATNTTGFTATAAQLTSGMATPCDCILALTGVLGGAANITTDTAANIVAAIPNVAVGQTYRLRIFNNSTGAYAWTVVAGASVTLTGTMTIAQNTGRDFIVSITAVGASPTVTLQSIGITGTGAL